MNQNDYSYYKSNGRLLYLCPSWGNPIYSLRAVKLTNATGLNILGSYNDKEQEEKGMG